MRVWGLVRCSAESGPKTAGQRWQRHRLQASMPQPGMSNLISRFRGLMGVKGLYGSPDFSQPDSQSGVGSTAKMNDDQILAT